jgi:RNA polymerase sigma-70 factor, ECF subfamily
MLGGRPFGRARPYPGREQADVPLPGGEHVKVCGARATCTEDTDRVIGAAFGAALAGAQDGDEAAFACIFRDIQPALLRYLRVIAPDGPDDVAGDTWVHVVDGLAGFRGDEASFRAWLFTIARHRAVDSGRWRSRRRAVALEDSGAAELLTAPDAADLALERMSTRAAVAAVATLPPDQAEIILLRVLAGLDTQQVARIVGKSPGAVRVAAHRGLRRLAALASSTGVTA